MGEYEKLRAIDIITPVMREIMEEGRFVYCEDGKFHPTLEKFKPIYVDGPWINVNPCKERNCFLWHKIYFNMYGIISRNCFNCWKVVFRPQTLDELMAVYDMQKKHGFPSKSGIERRDGSLHKGCYACFWYCSLDAGKEQAKETHKEIQRKIQHLLGIDKKVILKRGCTEMEDAAGPSHLWYFSDDQHVYEDLLDFAWSEVPPITYEEPAALKSTILMRWIGWAVKHRDPTAKRYFDSMGSFGVCPTTVYNDKEISVKSLPMTSKQWKEYNDDSIRVHSESDSPKIQGLPKD